MVRAVDAACLITMVPDGRPKGGTNSASQAHPFALSEADGLPWEAESGDHFEETTLLGTPRGETEKSVRYDQLKLVHQLGEGKQGWGNCCLCRNTGRNTKARRTFFLLYMCVYIHMEVI